MLLQACRDGDLDVVLRLLYTNPFINEQELKDGLWEAVRCRQVEVCRSLLEFRVDPACAPSPALSQPPPQLRHVPWTPLLGLAVSGSADRARLVAELLTGRKQCDLDPTVRPAAVQQPRGDGKPWLPVNKGAAQGQDAKGCSTLSPSAASSASAASLAPSPPSHKLAAHPAAPAPGKPAPAAEASSPKKQQPAAEASSPKQRRGGQAASAYPAAPVAPAPEADLGIAKKGAAPAAPVAAASEAEVVTVRNGGLLEGMLSGPGAGSMSARVASLKLEELAKLETELDGLLRTVRSHHKQRWEQQLQSVQRRHADECRDRQSLEEEQVCVVCSECEKTMLFLPCRHLCTCETCAGQLHQCPMCRANIEDRVRAYRS